ncbi:acetate/propionate family kinase [Daeguia caeni]|uniref:Acetate kinase n=1 Tax=Daeguia caeni TaxID=439612 RepID=A0ABV9HBR2_9HYPH
MSGFLLTFNAGSSTVKIGLFQFDQASARRIAKGVIDFGTEPPSFHLRQDNEAYAFMLTSKADAPIAAILLEVATHLSAHIDMNRIAMIGHRVVHGGDIFAGPVLIDDESLAKIDQLSSFAPLHQPRCVALIRALREAYPPLPQAASFDTAFHRTMPETVRRFALPAELYAQGIKRYGFHGLSYKSIIGKIATHDPALARKRIIAAHLGSGASLCAMKDGVSHDTSMSFSTLDGIPMATRSGALDPGVLLHLLSQNGHSTDELSDLLYHKSGLLGLSGISGDTRDLLADGSPAALAALDVFTLRIAGEICRLAATIGGIDALIFTAGIGENQPFVREAVCERLTWLGLELDKAANATNSFRITTQSSPVSAFVLETDEEQVIADETLATIMASDIASHGKG